MATAQRTNPPQAPCFGTEIERVALAWAERNRARRAVSHWAGAAAGSALGGIDPTGGATRYHRHDEDPRWARHLAPVALIGAYLFYAE